MSKGSVILLIALVGIGAYVAGNLNEGDDDGGSDSVEIAEGTTKAAAAADKEAGIQRYKVPVTGDEPAQGPDDALVTIVEFSEFQCPFCKRVMPTTAQIKKEYGDKVRFVWRNNPLPFHKDAGPAAQLAMEAHAQGGNEKFWEIHDVLFENQKALGREQLEGYAKAAGLDMAKVKAALDSNKYAESIKADQTVATQFGARGTPNFFVNGIQLRGAQPFPAFKKIIDAEIKRAEALVNDGTSKKDVYAVLTSAGLTKAVPPKAKKRSGQPDPKAVYKVPLTGNEPQNGPSDALVTIVEISDFECPFCGRVEPTIKKVVDKYGKDVRVVWMNNPLPFHKNAGPAANAALEAHQQKGNVGFWQMHAKLFSNQKGLTRDNLEKYAKEIGLNMGQFKTALDKNEFKATIDKQQALARSLGSSGTPAFFINGRNLRGAQPLPAFTALIDEELKKAKALVASGTPRSKVYETSIAKGLKKVAAAPSKPKQDPNKVYKIAASASAPFKGGKNAKVVIYEFSDFECPFCGRANPVIAQVLKEYGDKVKIVWRDYPLPFHKNAQPAAQASREVFKQGGNKKFWAYHDILFQNQKGLTRANLEKFAQQVGGIDMGAFKKALDSGVHKAAVDADVAAVAKAGARIGTPSFFINGKLIQGAQPFPAFKAAIDAALK